MQEGLERADVLQAFLPNLDLMRSSFSLSLYVLFNVTSDQSSTNERDKATASCTSGSRSQKMMAMVTVREAGPRDTTAFTHNRSDSKYGFLVSAARIKKCMSPVAEAMDLQSEHAGLCGESQQGSITPTVTLDLRCHVGDSKKWHQFGWLFAAAEDGWRF